jgi:hypothetical protein
MANPNAYLPYQDTFKPTADRYTDSTANYNDWVYFAKKPRLAGRIRVRGRAVAHSSAHQRALAGIGGCGLSLDLHARLGAQ